MGRDLGSGAIFIIASTRHAVILTNLGRLEVCPASEIESKLTNRSDTIAAPVTSRCSPPPICDDDRSAASTAMQFAWSWMGIPCSSPKT